MSTLRTGHSADELSRVPSGPQILTPTTSDSPLSFVLQQRVRLRTRHRAHEILRRQRCQRLELLEQHLLDGGEIVEVVLEMPRQQQHRVFELLFAGVEGAVAEIHDRDEGADCDRNDQRRTADRECRHRTEASTTDQPKQADVCAPPVSSMLSSVCGPMSPLPRHKGYRARMEEALGSWVIGVLTGDRASARSGSIVALRGPRHSLTPFAFGAGLARSRFEHVRLQRGLRRLAPPVPLAGRRSRRGCPGSRCLHRCSRRCSRAAARCDVDLAAVLGVLDLRLARTSTSRRRARASSSASTRRSRRAPRDRG